MDPHAAHRQVEYRAQVALEQLLRKPPVRAAVVGRLAVVVQGKEEPDRVATIGGFEVDAAPGRCGPP
ncbi:MAG: hypothetical protein ACYTA3_06855 [Planctomycetota bacterium]